MTDLMTEWRDAALENLDLIEIQEQRRPIDTYHAPADTPDDAARRAYFRGAGFPYADRLGTRAYYQQKFDLQIELVKMQNWVKETGQKLLILMEGRDAAGKGSTIKRFMEHLNPRGATVVALEKPTEKERSQWYFQRYVDHLPAAGEIVFFDRSWYNRAGVERVMGFCTPAQYDEFIRQAPRFEAMLRADGVTIFKFYLSISKAEQAQRFRERETNPLKQWKLSPIDVEAQARWDAYSEAELGTLQRTDTSAAPWMIIKSDDKLRGRLEAMRTVLHAMPYDEKNEHVAVAPDPWIVAPAQLVYGESADAP